MATTIRRIQPGQAWDKVSSGSARFVCAYEDREKCRRNALPHAVPLQDFRSRLGELSISEDIIFYCA